MGIAVVDILAKITANYRSVGQSARPRSPARRSAGRHAKLSKPCASKSGIPFYPADFNDTVIPHEARWKTTHINFTKGCYTGQEIVERVRSRGQVNRRRVKLKFSDAEPPPPARACALTAAKSASSPAPPFPRAINPPSAWATPAANTTLPAPSSKSTTAPPPKSSPSR